MNDANCTASPQSHSGKWPRAIITSIAALLFAAQFSTQAARADDQATEVGTDIGTLYREETAPLYKAPGYSRTPGEITPHAFSGVIPTCTLPIRWMPPPSATRSAPSRPTVSRAARKWSPPPASRPG